LLNKNFLHACQDEVPVSRLLMERLAVMAVDNKVILTQTSCGYLEFAVNWIYHVEALGITNWLTVCEDLAALNFLEDRFPGIAFQVSLSRLLRNKSNHLHSGHIGRKRSLSYFIVSQLFNAEVHGVYKQSSLVCGSLKP